MTTSAHPFPVFTFRLPPSSGLSSPVSRGFLFLPCILRFLSSPSPCTCGYSASCSSFQPSIGSASQWLSQRPALPSRFLRIFPFHPVWFPIQSFRFCLFSLLFVSFHPSLLRSHSRSTGAHFRSPSFPPVPFHVFSCRPLPFVHVRFRARLLSLCLFLSLLPRSPSTRVPCASFSSLPSACFHAFSTIPVLSHAAIPFYHTVRFTAASFCMGPLFSIRFRTLPLGPSP